MSRPRQVDPRAIALHLQASGPLSASALAGALRVDDSNIRRALTLPEIAPQLVRFGMRRGTNYALRRPVRGIGDTFAVRRIDADGRAQDWAELTTLHGGWRVVWADPARAPGWAGQVLGLGGWSEGFPFFLGDVRPQGYLGRAVGRALSPALGLDADPRNWSDDDTLVYLQTEGDDLPGDLVVGDLPLRRVQERLLRPAPSAVVDEARAERYPALAAAALSPGVGGSSVEGEQPKFLALAMTASPNTASVIVKFTDQLSTPTGRRWADLLVGEAHALALLHAQGEAHAVPRLLDAADRRFLENPRFDRVGAFGRRGVVSLRALHDAMPGAAAHDWPTAARGLAALGVLDAVALRSIRLRHTFGQLIGNRDMHFGNLAFWLEDDARFHLAPAYDMLPMLWAPVVGNATPTPDFAPTLPLPAEREIWHEAAVWAEDFWQRVAADERVSAEFAAIARAALATIRRLRAVA